MEISLVSIAFNGYGRYVGQFLAFVASMNPKPDEVIIVLGRNHGCEDLEILKLIYPSVKLIIVDDNPTFGRLRNIGIRKSTSEWTWFVSIDDKPELDAIQTFERAAENSDYICAQWNTIGMGEKIKRHVSPLPKEMADQLANGEKGGFIIPHSPFKKWLWEAHKYKRTNLPNYDFLLYCVINGARFTKGDWPTTTYMRRRNSHARTTLKKMMKDAMREKRKLQRGLAVYYA